MLNRKYRKYIRLIVYIIGFHSYFIFPKSICRKQLNSTTILMYTSILFSETSSNSKRTTTANILENKIVSTTIPLSYIPYYWGNFNPVGISSTINNFITTTFSYKFCNIFNGKSSMFGSLVHGSKSFLIKVSDLESMIIHSGEFLNAITFNFNDENSKTLGNLLNSEIISNTTINLTGKHIRSINIGYNFWIGNIQFEIYDTLTKRIITTSEFGGSGGSKTSINIKRMAPKGSKSFQINSFHISFDSSYIRTFGVGFSYEFCDFSLFKVK